MNYTKLIDAARNQYELDLLVPMLKQLSGTDIASARKLWASKRDKFASGYGAVAEEVMQGRYND